MNLLKAVSSLSVEYKRLEIVPERHVDALEWTRNKLIRRVDGRLRKQGLNMEAVQRLVIYLWKIDQPQWACPIKRDRASGEHGISDCLLSTLNVLFISKRQLNQVQCRFENGPRNT